MRVVIFGTNGTAARTVEKMKENEVVAYLDNDRNKWGEYIEGVEVLGNASAIKDLEYDAVCVCSQLGEYEIKKQLLEVGVPIEKIDTQYVDTLREARNNFLWCYAKENSFDDSCAVAEGGVYRGDYSRIISRCFPKKDLYLFDTFEGFDERDLKVEMNNDYSRQKSPYLSDTSVEIVLSKLLNRERVIVRKGYFPETTFDLEKRQYCFVNLDFDLYQPTYGLLFFWPQMVKRSIILVHDYFNPEFQGIRQAIKDFINELKISPLLLPIGDDWSIAIVKE